MTEKPRPMALRRVTTPSELAAGRIVGVFGLRGECKVDATRIGVDALAVGVVAAARLADGSERTLRVRSVRMHKGRPLVSFDDFNDIESAQALIGAAIVVDRADVALGPGEYLDSDLIGCRVITVPGIEVGRVVGVEHYPSQDMLVIGATRVLVPLVAAFVRSIDIAAKQIDLELPPGLLDERDADLG